MKIVFNGREYESLDQMPAEERQEYLFVMKTMGSDANGNGTNSDSLIVDESIEYDGKVYKSRSELPPDVRAMLDEMPPPNPNDIKSVKMRTTVLPTEIKVIHSRILGEPEEMMNEQRSNSTFPWVLVVILAVLLVAVLCFWLLGIKPSALRRH